MALTKSGRVNFQWAGANLISCASNDIAISTALDVSTYYEATIRIRMGRATGTAFTVSPDIRVEVSSVSGTPTADEWGLLTVVSPALGATVGSTAVSGTEAAGQTVVTLTSGTNFTANDFIFFHNTTLANSEWCHIKSVATNDITLWEAIVNAQTSATCRDQAEEFLIAANLVGINKVRIVGNGTTGTGQAFILAADLGAVTAL